MSRCPASIHSGIMLACQNLTILDVPMLKIYSRIYYLHYLLYQMAIYWHHKCIKWMELPILNTKADRDNPLHPHIQEDTRMRCISFRSVLRFCPIPRPSQRATQKDTASSSFPKQDDKACEQHSCILLFRVWIQQIFNYW